MSKQTHSHLTTKRWREHLKRIAPLGGLATKGRNLAIFAPVMASKAARIANKKNWADPVYRERMRWRKTPYFA